MGSSSPQIRPGARVLLVRLSALGDCVHALPVVAALRAQIPELYLGWAIGSAGHRLLGRLSEVDRFHVFPREARGWRRWRELARFRRELRAERYELAIDVQGLAKSGLVSWWSGASTRLGFAGFESRELNAAFMTKRRRVASETLHIVDRNLDLLSALGLARQPAAFPLPAFSPSSALAQLLAMTFPAGRFAVINPGATWCTKRWPVSRFSGLARRLAADLDLRSWVLWGNDRERADAQQLVADAGGAALLAPPTDLDDMAALIASSQLFVGNDTGPMHLACALGTPTVAVFGASDIRRNGPYSSNSLGLVALEPPACQPCQKTSCQRGDLACLEGVDEARVFWACRELLSRRPAPDALAPSGEAHAAV